MPGTRKAALAPLYAPGGGLLCFVRLGARGGLHGSVDKLLQTGQPGVERLKICDNGLSLCKQSLQLGFVIRRRHRGTPFGSGRLAPSPVKGADGLVRRRDSLHPEEG